MAKSGRIPFAKWQPISGRSRMSNKPRRVTVHIAVTDSPDIYGPGKGPGGTYAHCYNPVSGTLLQHQELHRKTYADLDGNGTTISVEHQGRPGDRMSANQIDNMARLFAHAVTEYGVPNRIATWNNTSGLAWHRLGCKGNFGTFSKHDRTTWSGSQTGQRWSTAYGKTCPTDRFINQLDEVFDRAQSYIKGEKPTSGGSPAPSKPKPSKPSKPSKPASPRKGPSGQGKAATKSIQRVMKRCGFYSGLIDGDYGPMTRDAVRAYQRGQNQHGDAGLHVDGDWGNVSRDWLNWTKQLQRALPKFKGISKLRVDGDYGLLVHNAVRTLQSRNGLHVDGIAGNVTAAFMRKHGSKIPNRPPNRP